LWGAFGLRIHNSAVPGRRGWSSGGVPAQRDAPIVVSQYLNKYDQAESQLSEWY